MPKAHNYAENAPKTSSSSHKTKIKYQYLLNEVEERQDAESALKLIQMITTGEIKVSMRSQGKLLFILHSKYEGTCIRCQGHYTYGDAIFCADRQGWHLKCRKLEEERQSFFQTCRKKGLLDM